MRLWLWLWSWLWCVGVVAAWVDAGVCGGAEGVVGASVVVVAAQARVWSRARGMIFLKSDLLKTGFVGRKFDLVLCS